MACPKVGQISIDLILKMHHPMTQVEHNRQNKEWGTQGKNQRSEALGVGYQMRGVQIKRDLTYPSERTSKTHPTKECDLTQGRLSALENVSNAARLPPKYRSRFPWML